VANRKLKESFEKLQSLLGARAGDGAPSFREMMGWPRPRKSGMHRKTSTLQRRPSHERVYPNRHRSGKEHLAGSDLNAKKAPSKAIMRIAVHEERTLTSGRGHIHVDVRPCRQAFAACLRIVAPFFQEKGAKRGKKALFYSKYGQFLKN
jgi:hypothetical protein